MEDVHEHELVERCRSGDEHAFQELVDRYKDLVFALIARTIQDRSRAEDLAQDVFLRIIVAPALRRSASLDLDLRIVANVCLQSTAGRPPQCRSTMSGRVEATPSGPDRQFGDLSCAIAPEGDRPSAGELPPVVAAHHLNGVQHEGWLRRCRCRRHGEDVHHTARGSCSGGSGNRFATRR
jgi:hypothetical protein